MLIRVGRHLEVLTSSLADADIPAPFKESGYAMFVADGLGSGGSGSVASRMALTTIAHMALHYGRWNVRIDPATTTDIFEQAERYYAMADDAVRSSAAASPMLQGMSTSLTTAYSAGDDLFVAHVGHSRAYLFRDGTLTQLTRDSTLEQHLSDFNTPAAVERRAQDLRHILTDAVGAPGGHPLVEVEKFRLANRDCVLLCTNGLTDMVGNDRIAEVLGLRRSPEEQCGILIDLANRAGGADNITVIVAEYQIPTA